MRERSFIVWFTLVALLLVVLNLPASVTGQAKAVLREGIAPLQGALTGLSRAVHEAVESVRGLGGLVAQNQTLSSEVARLRNEVRRLQALESENISLREQLHYAGTSSRDLIPCEVIARDISGWWQTIRIGKGAADGVEENMAVITTEGLLGRTVASSPRTADVLLISDPTCRVSARIVRTGVFGVVTGRGTSWKGEVLCQVDFINKDTPVRPGDELETSGLGGVFPKGLLIGYVDRVELDSSGLYQKAQVIPKADLGSLTHVFVVAQPEDPVEELLRTRGLRREGPL